VRERYALIVEKNMLTRNANSLLTALALIRPQNSFSRAYSHETD
jgi:hypothetical protein